MHSHQRSTPIRRRLLCGLLAFMALASGLGEPADLVLCIEAGGQVSLETPAEQAACRLRHSLSLQTAATAATTTATSTSIVKSGDLASGVCFDIPLNVGHCTAVSRASSLARHTTGPLRGYLAPAGAAQILAISRPAIDGVCQSQTAAPTFDNLRTIVLRI